MKKILCLALWALLFLPTATVLAQDDDDDKPFQKGIRVGWQDSNFSNSELDDLSSFYVGFFGVKKIGTGKMLAMYSGLEYYQTGTTENSDNQIVLGYISIPINLRLKLGPIYAFGGFNPSFKVYEQVKFLGVDVGDQVDINGFDIGGQLGLGVKFLFMGLEVKYNQGLTNVFTDDITDEDNTTHHVQLGICVYF